MAKSPNQKLKLLYLQQILLQRTDEDHPISMEEMRKALQDYNIKAERKSIYSDLEAFKAFWSGGRVPPWRERRLLCGGPPL